MLTISFLNKNVIIIGHKNFNNQNEQTIQKYNLPCCPTKVGVCGCCLTVEPGVWIIGEIGGLGAWRSESAGRGEQE